MKLAGYDKTLANFPKTKALAERAAGSLSTSFPTKFTDANPFNMP